MSRQHALAGISLRERAPGDESSGGPVVSHRPAVDPRVLVPPDFRRQGSGRLTRALLQPVDAAWLAALRILLGCVLGVSMLRFLAYGWIERFWVTPSFHFKYWGFGWVEPLAGPQLHGLFVALVVLAFMVAAGALFRLSAVLFAAGLSYVQLLDVTTYLNHYYLAALLGWLLSVTPANRVWSVDAWVLARWRARRGQVGAVQPQIVAAGVFWLFRLQVAVVYVFAGLAKLQSDWLVHAQPLRIWLGASVELPGLGPILTWSWVPLAMSWAGFLFDTTIVAWLSFRRTRPAAYAVVIVFHLLTRILFPIGMFPAIMIVAALVFFPPDWPRQLLAASGRTLARLGVGVGRAPLQPAAAGAVPAVALARPTKRQQFLIAVGVVYCLVQLLLPMRSFAYGGNVLWHEQGMRFSWRVMVRAKGGVTTFVVHDRSTGRTFHVSPRQYVNDLQESELVGQPDLILQLARHIRRDLEGRGIGPVEVRVDARASLNGRPSAPLIDPRVDLSRIEDGLGKAAWILPAPARPPPHTRPVR